MTDYAKAILNQVAHRPWPLPPGPWVLEQSWNDVLFAHWPLDFATVRTRVPEPLELDTFDGRAWVGAVTMRIDPLRTRIVPLALRFPELNLRTCVRLHGQSGVYFFSLDAANRLAVIGGRTLFRLNYYEAAIAFVADSHFDFTSRRLERPHANFHARYRPAGSALAVNPTTIEEWLVERYCLYAARPGGATFRVQVHHRPWVLSPAEAEVSADELFFAAQLPVPRSPPMLHYSARQDALTWGPEPV